MGDNFMHFIRIQLLNLLCPSNYQEILYRSDKGWGYLVFVKLTVLEGCLPLWLEGHYDEADEDVDHEEGDDDDVDEVKESNVSSVVMNWSMVNFVGVYGDVEDARPPLEGHGDEEGEHRLGNVVKVELVLCPDSLVHCEQTLRTIFWHQIFSVAVVLGLHAPVAAHPEASLEQLDANDGKHEEEEDGDEEDVADVLHSHDDALHHVLQTLGSVDRSANAKCSM